MEWIAVAYKNGKFVKPIWESYGYNYIPTDVTLNVPETKNPILFLDMGGIMRNRPNPSLLPFDPDNTYVDFGLIWGDDIIDLIMLNRGKVVIPLRKLQGFAELDEALTYAEDVAIAIDWSQSVEAEHSDFSIDIVELLQSLHYRNQTDILIYSLNGDYPYIPAGTAVNLDLKLVYLSEFKSQPQWSKGVFVFE